jgi:non-ribosomal peptide synthetase component F
MWTPLVIGAQLVIARPGGHVDPEYIADLLDEHKVTFFNTGVLCSGRHNFSAAWFPKS